MKSVIFIPEEGQTNEKPVEFTHYLSGVSGWVELEHGPYNEQKIIYLGSCVVEGDLFAIHHDGGAIEIYKGHLNSGKY